MLTFVFICKIQHMYASQASLLRLPPPRRRVTRGKFAFAGRGRPLVIHLRSGTPASVLLKGGTPRGDSLAYFGRSKPVGNPGSIAPAGVRCRGIDPAPQRNDAPSLAGALKNPLNLKTHAGAVFSLGHLPPRRRET
jgi:hypothetical protein